MHLKMLSHHKFMIRVFKNSNSKKNHKSNKRKREVIIILNKLL